MVTQHIAAGTGMAAAMVGGQAHHQNGGGQCRRSMLCVLVFSLSSIRVVRCTEVVHDSARALIAARK